ncbi:hypothetical protein [Hydrogenophaga crocea]|uniref:Sulfatase N-terminal domain-containing protein n=1 Tax=Hydrogenophaga crocea TaxID=2716225 RepID=A0A6G8IFL9_9BURK|nr:hypothetical protein [Hydrogenophaga crocea]QIM51972.1 hypothetical protein G9Q37_07385 [Hydrogenophaga crocea]
MTPGLAWLLRFGGAFALLNALLTFENRWPGLGVHAMPRLSFELCLGLAALLAWMAWRGLPGRRALTLLALGFVALVLVRYANVTAPALLGRPVNLYWDGRHALELLRVAAGSVPAWQVAAAAAALLLGGALLVLAVRALIAVLAQALQAPRPRPWLLAGVAALSASFAAYVPGERDTRWFFSLPVTPTLWQQAGLLARVVLPAQHDGLGESPAFDGGLQALATPQGPGDVLLVFAESYGMVAFDRPDQAAALAGARAAFEATARAQGLEVLSARVGSPTFGGASWLAHAGLLAGVDTHDPADHDLLLTSDRPTLVRHFANHGYRTVGWMPGLKRPWPEGRFYGFERLADDAGIGYQGPDFGYWRIPDQAAMALLRAQELDAPARADDARPRFVVFPTTSTHAPFHPLAPFVDEVQRLTGPQAYSADEAARALAAPLALRDPLAPYLDSLRGQYAWLAQHLRQPRAAPQLLIVVGDHQPPGAVSGRGAPWEVPVHVVGARGALRQHLIDEGFVPGLTPPAQSLGPLHRLTRVLLDAFDAPQPPDDADSPGEPGMHVARRRALGQGT